MDWLPATTTPASPVLLSPVLQPGDRVALLSPASFPDAEAVSDAAAVLTGWGLRVEVGAHALDQWGYMAGQDHNRLEDLNQAFRDPGVRAIIATRGGAGSYRIADGIDFDAVRADPKPVVGFSDITNLHLALWRHCALSSIHGCLAGDHARASVRQLLMTTDAIVLKRDSSAMSAGIEVPGCAVGPLVGGNLAAMAESVGVVLPPLRGCILFLEDFRSMGLGRVDRQLTQLLRSRSLEGIAGIALGLFTGFDEFNDRGWTLLDVMRDRLEPLGVPILGGLQLGHGGSGPEGDADQLAVPIGPVARLDTGAGTLTVGPCVR